LLARCRAEPSPDPGRCCERTSRCGGPRHRRPAGVWTSHRSGIEPEHPWRRGPGHPPALAGLPPATSFLASSVSIGHFEGTERGVTLPLRGAYRCRASVPRPPTPNPRGLSALPEGRPSAAPKWTRPVDETSGREWPHKPGPVLPEGRGDPFSRTALARGLERPTRGRVARVVACAPLFGLSPGGVYRAGPVARPAVRSYRTLSPLPPLRRAEAVCFLWHFPWPCGRWPLATTLTRGARTFLPAASCATVAWTTPVRLNGSAPRARLSRAAPC
jgi:hypothetical protein